MRLPFYDWYRNLIRNSKYRWVIIVGTLLYLISPIDLLPDFIPLIGQIDDAVVVTLLAAELSGLLLDRVKTQKNKNVSADTTVASAETVDVNATSV
ncbi:DUF1232 domain-containing protein [Phormidesmis priestleyi ULC007]|uniref:DUF1232 domain-containing protein n=1 Tax=Phormidesmis priestleyi ULC007 TaxID=1920490 RepID=A0A2T1DGM8_9CYAN|nr:YkvA family protein [Phormidesmis priestleyi]PSB19659.1 DUF1232 domain-containing protein [Phormidesmis priestleyi ULC007]PZO53543.1 MAG: DUF1232 domain-containing protein [Phormidesmis priestleyi]